MLGKCIEELFLVNEVLIELRRQFNEVTRHIRSALRLIHAENTLKDTQIENIMNRLKATFEEKFNATLR